MAFMRAATDINAAAMKAKARRKRIDRIDRTENRRIVPVDMIDYYRRRAFRYIAACWYEGYKNIKGKKQDTRARKERVRAVWWAKATEMVQPGMTVDVVRRSIEAIKDTMTLDHRMRLEKGGIGFITRRGPISVEEKLVAKERWAEEKERRRHDSTE